MPIAFNVPYLSGRESEYIEQVFEQGHFAGNGDFTNRCQRLLEEKYGIPHVLLTTSCTAALELAAMVQGIGSGDEVIIPSYTFVSTASAFMRNGAEVVFADIDPDTLMLDPQDVEKRITSRTKAVVPVHYAGHSADMDTLSSLCTDHGLILIEDAAQGLASALDGRWLGSFGSLGCISFHETKNIHCGLGGAIFINDPSLFDQAEDVWERGTNRSKMFKGLVDKYSWVELGSSFYPSEIQAAFLLAQLESMDRNLKQRGVLTDEYRRLLSELERKGLVKQQDSPEGGTWNHHAVVIILESDNLADSVRLALKSEDIHAFIGYVPLHSSSMGLRLGWSPDDLPVTENVAPRVLRLPIHNEMTIDDVHRVCDAISSCLSEPTKK